MSRARIGNVRPLRDKFGKALTLHQMDRLAEAEELYEEILRRQPGHTSALHYLGVVALQTRRTELGVTLIERAIALDRGNAAMHCNLGLGLAALQRYGEAVASFDRAIALVPEHAEAYSNRGNALRTLRRFEEALESFDKAIALQPDMAEAHNNRGNALRDLRRTEEALRSYDTAIALAPELTEAHSNRGNVLHDLRRYDEALVSCVRAIMLKPDYAEAHNNRGNALSGLRRYAEAVASYDKAIALNPDYAEAYDNRGVALRDLGRSEDALASFDAAIGLRPDHAEAHWNKSLCLLQLGQFDHGWPLYEWRRKIGQPIADRADGRPLWLGQRDIAGKTLFLHWEQGLGDTLQFCRYAALVKALEAHVILSVQDPLLGLLKQLEPGIEIIGGSEIPDAYDYHCPLMSLPLALGTTLETIPSPARYLAAERQLQAEWASRLPPPSKPRIGVVWKGNIAHRNDHNRSTKLAVFLPLLRDDIEGIALQKKIDDEDAMLLRQDGRMAAIGDGLKNFSDTAAVIELMDLVITIDTAVAHLAGAMGKPVWILLPYNADWRWLKDRNDSPWYPSARLFRQSKIGNWADVVEQVRQALIEEPLGRRPEPLGTDR